MTDIDSKQRGRDQISALVAAHGAFTQAAVQASQLMTAKGRKKFAAHLDRHRAELNVAIGEFGLWAEVSGIGPVLMSVRPYIRRCRAGRPSP